MSLSNRQLQTLRMQAVRAVDTESTASLNLSRLVWETKHARLTGEPKKEPWEHWGFSSWEEYLNADLQMSVRTALEHLRIWDVFGIALKGKWAPKKVLPFSKMALIAMMALHATSVDDLLDACRTMTVADIKAMVRGHNPHPKTVTRFVTTAITLDQPGFSEYLGHQSTMRLVHGAISRGEAVLIAFRFYMMNCPDVTGLIPTATTTANTPAKKRATKKAKKAKKAKKGTT